MEDENIKIIENIEEYIRRQIKLGEEAEKEALDKILKENE